MNEQIREFILVYENGGKDITRHYNIEDVKKDYLNKQVRSSKGTLEVCVKVLSNG